MEYKAPEDEQKEKYQQQEKKLRYNWGIILFVLLVLTLGSRHLFKKNEKFISKHYGWTDENDEPFEMTGEDIFVDSLMEDTIITDEEELLELQKQYNRALKSQPVE